MFGVYLTLTSHLLSINDPFELAVVALADNDTPFLDGNGVDREEDTLLQDAGAETVNTDRTGNLTDAETTVEAFQEHVLERLFLVLGISR